jgi:hypothetical protein
MARRPRATRPPRSDSDQFVPKPPPRKSVEKPIADSFPEPGQRQLPRIPSRLDDGQILDNQEAPFSRLAPSSPRAEFRNLNPPLQHPEIPPVPPPGQRPTGAESEILLKRLDANVRRTEEERKAKEPERTSGNELLVPMVCARTKQAFVVRFTRASISDRWRGAEAFLVGDGNGNAAPKAMKVPIREMNWDGIVCPGCGQRCGPFLCTECQQLGCHGGVTFAAPLRRIYRCSCGATGFLEPSLKEVSGAKAARAQEPESAASSPATSLVRRLPRPE